MNVLLRFEVSTAEVEAVLEGLRLRGFAVEVGPRLPGRDVQLVCVEADPSDVDAVDDAVRILSEGAARTS